MANQSQAANKNQNVHPSMTPEQVVEPDAAVENANLTPLSIGMGSAAGEDPVDRQRDLLNDTRFQLIQRQVMAQEIGLRHGNRHLKNILAVVEGKIYGRGLSGNRQNGKLVQRQSETGVIQRQNGGNSTPIPILPDVKARRALALKVLKEAYGGLIRQESKVTGASTSELRVLYDASMISQGKTFTESDGTSNPWKSGDSARHPTTSGEFPGFFDSVSKKIIIDTSKDPDEQVVTLAHEMLHANSAGDLVTTLGRDVDEGMTESLTQKAFKDAGYSTAGGFFVGQMAFVGRLSSLVGANTMKFAYFRGVGILRSMMENALEEGVFARFAIEVKKRNWAWLNPFFERFQRTLTGSETDKKIAAVNSLLDWWVSDADIDHIANIWNGSSEEEQRRIRTAILSRISSLSDHGQRARLRSIMY